MSHRLQHLTWIAGTAVLVAMRLASACPESAELARIKADAALAARDYELARQSYVQVTETCPDDASAWREAGRTALVSASPGFTEDPIARADVNFAIDALARADALAHKAPDPELHFLRGEALYRAGRVADARQEHDEAIREIGPVPTDRMRRLWLAKIYIRRADYVAADDVFEMLDRAAGPAGDEEAVVTHAEAHIQARKFGRAETILRRLLKQQPASIRAKELLAWVYELDGDIDRELAIRLELLEGKPDHGCGAGCDPTTHRHYGRALERASQLRTALTEYQHARSAGGEDAELIAAIERVSQRISPELQVAATTLVESGANALRLQIGGAIPVTGPLTLGVIGWRDDGHRDVGSTGGIDATTTGVATSIGLVHRSGMALRVAGSFRHSSLPRKVPGDFVQLTSNILGAEVSGHATAGPVVIDAHASYHAPWTDAALSVVEGGDQTAASLHVGYPLLDGRLVLDAAALQRELYLSRDIREIVPVARHRAWSAGVDFVAWANPKRRVRGEVLDERLDKPAHLQDAVIIKVRHYDAYVDTDAAFLDRIVLVPRASAEVISAVGRKVLLGDRLGLELYGSLGYDRERGVTLSEAGLSVLGSPWSKGRFTFQANIATETAGVVLGRREWVLASYHHDLY